MKGKLNIGHTVTLKTILHEYQANRKCDNNVMKQLKQTKVLIFLRLATAPQNIFTV